METLGIGLHFEDAPVGRKFKTIGRTVTETDIVNFVNCTGMVEVLFTNIEFLKNESDIKGRLAPAAVVYALSEGLLVQATMQHTGYAFHAGADYFQEVADRGGDSLGVDKGRRFSGLSGYRKLIESGVEAVIFETPPYFLPEQAAAAVAAGLHVFMAKPVAVDVPGCLAIEAAGKLATGKQRVFLVDYQMPTEPSNIEVVKRIREGAIGELAQIQTFGVGSGSADLPKTSTIESRLQNLIWINDISLGCDYIGN